MKHIEALQNFAAEGRKCSLVPFGAKCNSIKGEAERRFVSLGPWSGARCRLICQLTPALVSRGPSAKASETRFPLKITRRVCPRRQTAARSPSCVGDGPLLRDGAAGRPHTSASPWAKFKPLQQCTCLIFKDLFLFLPIYTLSPGNSTCAVFVFFLKCKEKVRH